METTRFGERLDGWGFGVFLARHGIARMRRAPFDSATALLTDFRHVAEYRGAALCWESPGDCAPPPDTVPLRAWMLRVIGTDADGRGRPSRCLPPIYSARSHTMLVACFVVALFVVLFAVIAAMHRAVTRDADANLRARFDAEGPRGDAARRLMRDAGYGV
ncbi:hypothetical protein [Burkholderia sp. MSMB1072]|uniref:hypothetical protein n=1 Tax=Burkholderia sp. MSMB1072 TaxID=1637871 RepID=UPI0012E3617F|nr:hypothetical protein [Burkholderia sp. MSMB1072]